VLEELLGLNRRAMKKPNKTPAKPLLVSTEKVRPLDPERLQHVTGGGFLPCSKSYSDGNQ
jgi:hypothetical protein